MSQLRSELQEVFRQVFDDDSLAVTEATTAVDIDGWDSMAHINLIIAIEKQFAIKSSAVEIGGLSRRGRLEAIGKMIQLIQTKTIADQARTSQGLVVLTATQSRKWFVNCSDISQWNTTRPFPCIGESIVREAESGRRICAVTAVLPSGVT